MLQQVQLEQIETIENEIVYIFGLRRFLPTSAK